MSSESVTRAQVIQVILNGVEVRERLMSPRIVTFPLSDDDRAILVNQYVDKYKASDASLADTDTLDFVPDGSVDPSTSLLSLILSYFSFVSHLSLFCSTLASEVVYGGPGTMRDPFADFLKRSRVRYHV